MKHSAVLQQQDGDAKFPTTKTLTWSCMKRVDEKRVETNKCLNGIRVFSCET